MVADPAIGDPAIGDDVSSHACSISRDMSEHCYNVNIGDTVGDAMKGVAAAAGGSVQPFRFRVPIEH